ncbi:hypothetical protein [Geodermatophilus ruber]|uniref:Thymidylate kinase n=1 Tax=Geodermatophilus ruber TaxID=504800 RepID=A0A1I4DJQ4_9ACTN|nr:hypothetical protein [Geodermatophilus ruber]SFK92081.1 Thymidylate kinase [Geodermatophilus ruber]
MTQVAGREISRGREALVRAALAALDEAGIEHALRNGAVDVSDPAADLDVLVRPGDRTRVHRALLAAGWVWLRAPGHRGHRFYLREAADLTWVKLDVVSALRYGRARTSTDELLDRRVRRDGLWLVSDADARQHAAHRAAGRREIPTPGERLARALPTSLHRRGCVVAVLGPDGAGKGTVTAGLAAGLPVGVTRVYLGDRRAQTAAAAAATATARPPGSHGAGRSAREVLFLLRKLAGWAPALLRASVAAWRGHVVLTDRHPLDAVAVRPRRTPVGRWVEHVLATRVVPSPDAVVVLDAPGQVLFDRKGEHTPELLEEWRQGYRRRLRRHGAVLVDAAGPVEQTTASVRHVVWTALARRRGWPAP